MSEVKQPEVGDAVIFVDPRGVDHNAIVITRWSSNMINLVRASDATDQTDSYGRQIVRDTSVPHKTNSPTHGYHWRWADEEKTPITQPESV